MKDKNVICIQCENRFVLTKEEQEKLLSRGFGLPRRCHECRKKKFKNIHDSKNDWTRKEKKGQNRGKRRDFEEDM